KRQKIDHACQICRDRKVRCDGGRPVCGSCQRRGHGQDECLYDELAAPTYSYIETLESRLKRLEDTI
ncbi:uncharacterized protein B0I36DRAFT_211340, partial [Microdochium trichocladiopsis]